jgi:serine/threonine-protein kinase RsbW
MNLEYNQKLTIKDVPQFTKDILEELAPFDAGKDTIFDIRLAVEEALINAIKYGNKEDKNKSVFIKLSGDSNKVEIEIKDQGQGYDYKHTPLPTLDENLERLSGRGVYLIKKIMDEVCFLDDGSRIKMVKYLKK